MSENHDPGRPGSPRAHHEQEAMAAKAGKGERPRAPDVAAPLDAAAVGGAAAGPEAGAGQGETALGFRQAMEELEGILERIEGEEIDIDQLAQELRRAAQLLDLCRGKIRKAEVEVTQIVQSLTETSESGESSESAGSGENSGERGAGGSNGESGDPRGRGGS
ncbi:MAG TPA: exodeoxyribonuclease VII small subunit [Thermoanaerobaculia bacterium]|nr:exodeoxyribonuclease VII small subunit [Thermoanaerobaculia bacterium]